MCEIMSDVIVCSLNANAFGIFNKQLCGLRSRANGTDRECARVKMSNATKFTKYLCTIRFSRHFNYHWPIVCCYTYICGEYDFISSLTFSDCISFYICIYSPNETNTLVSLFNHRCASGINILDFHLAKCSKYADLLNVRIEDRK